MPFTLSIRLACQPCPGAPVHPRHQCLDRDPHECHGDEYLPPESHDLVVAIPGERRAQPEKGEYEKCDLQRQPEKARLTEEVVLAEERPSFEKGRPAAEKEDGGKR